MGRNDVFMGAGCGDDRPKEILIIRRFFFLVVRYLTASSVYEYVLGRWRQPSTDGAMDR